MSTPEERVLPSWFDETKHSAGIGGIYETATNTLLDEAGEPFSVAVRLARAAAADAATADAAPPAETKPTKPQRGTPAAPETKE